MISLTCTSCKKVLQIDDAFAGGVCRCQHCGTIQTVPARLRRSIQPGVPPSGASAKTLYQKKAPPPPAPASGSGLARLADNVVGGGGLAPGAPRSRATAPAEARRRNLRPIVVAGGATIVILLIVIIWLAKRSLFQPEQTQHAPGFGDIALDVPSVIYLIDRDESTRPAFADLKAVTLKSIARLGPDRQFQIVFWNIGPDTLIPRGGLANATPENVAEARSALDEVLVFGRTDLRPSLQRAVDQKPAAIVIATAKGWDLDASFVDMVDEVVGRSGIKLHCLTVGAGGSSKSLETVAHRSGGEYREVTEDQLRAWAR